MDVSTCPTQIVTELKEVGWEISMTKTTLTIVVANTTQFCRYRNSAVRTFTYKIKNIPPL